MTDEAIPQDIVEEVPAQDGSYLNWTLPDGRTGREVEYEINNHGLYRQYQNRVKAIAKVRFLESDPKTPGRPRQNWNKARYAAMLEYLSGKLGPSDKEYLASKPETPTEDETFVHKCKVFLGTKNNLSTTGVLEDEINWVIRVIHLAEPDFHGCPSLRAVAMVIDARTDQRLRSKIWDMTLGGKLAASPQQPRGQTASPQEDEGETDPDHAELMQRLFGGKNGG